MPARRTATSSRTQRLLRELAPQVLGVVVRRYRDFAACEDAVQEAFIAAAAQWPREGMPDNPRAWLIQVASRRITDQVRAEAARRHREALVVSLIPADEQIALAADTDGATERDDTLDLLFMCCHPALSPASAIALTLARGRRPDHRRDRARVPGARGDDGAADQPRQADHQGVGRRRSRCRRATSWPRGWAA